MTLKNTLLSMKYGLQHAAQKVIDVLPAFKSPPYVWPDVDLPQDFPTAPGGRLPGSIAEIKQFRSRDLTLPSCHTCLKKLKISLFFDGTDCNEEADKVVSGDAPPTAAQLAADSRQGVQAAQIKKMTYPRTSNVARLYHACRGAGGGASVTSYDPKMIKDGHFRHYIQGVGTRFKEIGDLNPGLFSDAMALYSEERINWGLTRVCASLGLSECFETSGGIHPRKLDLAEAQGMIKNMHSADGRKHELDRFFAGLQRSRRLPNPTFIMLYVCGSSRGAAEARTFINWLFDYLLSREENQAMRVWIDNIEQLEAAKAKLKAQNDAIAKAKAKGEPAPLKTIHSRDITQMTDDIYEQGKNWPQASKDQLDYLMNNDIREQSGSYNGDTTDATTKAGTRPYEQAGLTLLGVPVCVQMLGLFDTVAGITTTPMLPMMTGHSGWANKTMSLQRPGRAGFIVQAQHFVAAHEQCKSLALESISISGGYPGKNSHEVLYPGVAADIGGGYAPGEQFRANHGMGHVLSQIMLHDMYDHFYKAGMPLQVMASKPDLAADLLKYPDFSLTNEEIMSRDTQKEFAIEKELVARFNHWLAAARKPAPPPANGGASQKPPARPDLNHSMHRQVQHYTAWRVLRQVKDNVDGYARFLGISADSHSAGNKEDARQKAARQKIIQHQRQQANSAYTGSADNQPPLTQDDWNEAGWDSTQGVGDLLNKNYSGSNDGWDMLEAAREFHGDYLHQLHFESLSLGTILDTTMSGTMAMLNPDDEVAEFDDIHKNGTSQYFYGFDAPLQDPPPVVPDKNPSIGHQLGNADWGAVLASAGKTYLEQEKAGKHGKERLKATGKAFWDEVKKGDQRKMAQLKNIIRNHPGKLSDDQPMVELYDLHLHDTRAWLLHDSPLQSREPFSNYFTYRLAYSGDYSNKPLSGVMLARRIVGLAGVARSAYMAVRFRNPAYLLLGLNNPELFVSKDLQTALNELGKNYDRVLIDPLTGKVLPTADNAKQLWDFGNNLGDVVNAMGKEYKQPPKEWSGPQFANAVLQQQQKKDQITSDTMKNLTEVQKLLEEKKAAAKKANAAKLQAATQQQLQQLKSSRTLLQEAVDKAHQHGQPVPAIDAVIDPLSGQPAEQVRKLKALLPPAPAWPAISQNVLRPEQEIQAAGSGALKPLPAPQQAVAATADTVPAPAAAQHSQPAGAAVLPAQQSGVLPAAQQAPAAGQPSAAALPAAGALVAGSPAAAESAAAVVAPPLAQYRQSLAAAGAGSNPLAWLDHSHEQALNRTQEQLTVRTLHNLGVESEVNEYLLGRLITSERSGISQLAQQLASGETVPELGTLTAARRQMMLKILQYWLG